MLYYTQYIIYCILHLVRADTFSHYKSLRQEILQTEFANHLGQELILTEPELKVNEKLMLEKWKELDDAIQNGEFLPAKSFYLSKPEIEKSKVYQFISQMPKGAALHTHSISLGSIKWMVSNLTYWDGLYMNFDESSQKLEFAWFEREPNNEIKKWKNVNQERRFYGSESVDQFLTKHLSCELDLTQTSNINQIWRRFKRTLVAIHGLIFYLPAFNAYLYTALGNLSDACFLSSFPVSNILNISFKTLFKIKIELSA